MPPSYPFLDTPCPELVADGNAITFYCRCGHYDQMRASEFERWPASSLHRVAAKLKCRSCGAVGDVASIVLNPEHTGGFGYKL